MTVQIKINDDRKTTFNDLNGKFRKSYINDSELYVTFEYKTLDGMIKAAKRISNDKTEVIVYNKEGNGSYSDINSI